MWLFLLYVGTYRSHPYAKASFRSIQSGEEVKNIEIDNKTQCPIVNILSNRRWVYHLCSLPVFITVLTVHVHVYRVLIFTVAFSVVVVVRSRECIVVVNAATLVPSFYIKSEYLNVVTLDIHGNKVNLPKYSCLREKYSIYLFIFSAR